jgi:PTS system fructose-specific IIC component
MDITGMITPERIVTLSNTEKEAALVELAEVLGGSDAVTSTQDLIKAIVEREEIMSTGIGQEFAVPHAKLPTISAFSIALGLCPAGMDYGSLDRQPVKIIAMIAAPEGEQNTYLKVLKRVTEVLRTKTNRNQILDLVANGRPEAVTELFAG